MIADRTVYYVRYILAIFQTGFGHKSTNNWYAQSDSTGRVYERTQTSSNQAWPLSVTGQSSVVHNNMKSVNNRTWHDQCTLNCLSQKTHVRVSFDSFFPVRFAAKPIGYYRQSVDKYARRSCLLRTRWYASTFSPVHRPCRQPQCTALQRDGRTDGRTTWWCQ